MTGPNPQSRPGAVRRRIDEVLADRSWHAIGDVIDATIGHVPPGKAARNAERNRARKNTAGGPRTSSWTKQDPQLTGARQLVRASIRSGLRRGTLQRDGDRIRLTPR